LVARRAAATIGAAMWGHLPLAGDRLRENQGAQARAAVARAGEVSPPFPDGFRWLTGRGAPRYSLAVRALPRAVRVPRDPVGGRTAPNTYDLTK
jgi:hypothetical protein